MRVIGLRMKTANKLKKEQRERRKAQGYVERTVWVHRDDLWHFKLMVKRLSMFAKYKRHKS